MTLDGWDWGGIHVLTGEWWLALITLAALLIGLGLGYALGAARERDRWRREGYQLDDPFGPEGGASRL